MKHQNKTVRANGTWQGMNWIRQDKRLAIYLRDGLACVYCGDGIEDGAQFTLDHVVPHSKGGTNHQTNLVTACGECNNSRGCKPLSKWSPPSIARVRRLTARSIKKLRIEAQKLIARRGSALNVLQSLKGGAR